MEGDPGPRVSFASVEKSILLVFSLSLSLLFFLSYRKQKGRFTQDWLCSRVRLVKNHCHIYNSIFFAGKRKRIAMKKQNKTKTRKSNNKNKVRKKRNDRLPVFVFPHASQLQVQRLWSLLFSGGDCNLKPALTPIPWTGPVSATLIFWPLHQFFVNQKLICFRVFCFVFDFLFFATKRWSLLNFIPCTTLPKNLDRAFGTLTNTTMFILQYHLHRWCCKKREEKNRKTDL